MAADNWPSIEHRENASDNTPRFAITDLTVNDAEMLSNAVTSRIARNRAVIDDPEISPEHKAALAEENERCEHIRRAFDYISA